MALAADVFGSAVTAGVSPEGGSTSGRVPRAQVIAHAQHQRFRILKRSYILQYSHIYTRRLVALRPLVLHAAKQRWSDARGAPLRVCSRIIELEAAASGSRTSGSRSGAGAATDEWVVSGCIFKDMCLKPSVLDSYAGDRSVVPPLPRANYTSDTDTLILEDETGRVLLTPGFRAAPGPDGEFHRDPFPLARLARALVTGVVLAIRGRVQEDGAFAVDDVVVPGLTLTRDPGAALHEPVAFPAIPARAGSAPPTFALLVSGLSLGWSRPGTHPLASQLLVDWACGLAGSRAEATGAGRIARVIIAGGTVGRPPPTLAGFGKGPSSAAAVGAAASAAASGGLSAAAPTPFSDRAVTAAEQEAAAAALREADGLLARLASAVPVDLMPGEGEPSNATLPQQPLHPCLLPLSARLSSFHGVTNPYACSLAPADTAGSAGAAGGSAASAGVRFLGTSGQNVADIMRYTAESFVTAPGNETGEAREAGVAVDSATSGAAGAARAGGGAGAGMDEEGASAASGGGGAGRLGIARVSADGEEEEAPEALVEATGATSADKTLAVVAGTGAGAGYEARMAASAAEDAGTVIVAAMDPLDVLTNTLMWRHVAPTAPDSLPCYPFADSDPFVIQSDQLPHVYFAGFQRGFGTRLVSDTSGSVRVRVVAVPDFSLTHTAVLVDISSPTLDAQPVCFALGGAGAAALGAAARAAPAAAGGGGAGRARAPGAATVSGVGLRFRLTS